MVIVIAFSQKSVWNQKEKNIHSAGLLWYGFLRYYTEEFDFEHDVVCCRRTRKLTKFEKMWTKHVFAIEGKGLVCYLLEPNNRYLILTNSRVYFHENEKNPSFIINNKAFN